MLPFLVHSVLGLRCEIFLLASLSVECSKSFNNCFERTTATYFTNLAQEKISKNHRLCSRSHIVGFKRYRLVPTISLQIQLKGVLVYIVITNFTDYNNTL